MSPEQKQFTYIQTKLSERTKMFIAFIADYLTECNIHGLQYVVKRDITTIEKCLWSILLIISLYFCVQLGLESVDRYYTKSTVVGLERDYYYWNTTMPSVTICPLARLDRQLFNEYKRQKNLNGSQAEILFEFLEALANTTYSNVRNIPINNEIDIILDKLDVKPLNYMDLIYNLTEDKTLKYFQDIDNPLDKIRAISGDFIIATRQILTEYGLCYMTNSMLDNKYSASYMIKGNLIPMDIDKSPFYIKVKKCSYFEDDVNYNVLGFDVSPINVFLHSPFDVMKVDQNLGFTPESLQLKVESMETVTEENFKNGASVDRRKCRFQHENNLTYFPIFTSNLCYQECRLNLVYRTCNCVPHFYARASANPKPVCNYRVLKECLSENEELFTKLYQVDQDGNKILVNCYCLQNCEDSLVNIRTKFTMANTNALVGGNSLLFDMVNLPKQRLKRQVIFSVWDLLVCLGSTAGLFLGFSVLSLVEIMYYFTLKFLCELLKTYQPK